MALSKEQIKNVEEVLKASLRNKFQNYKPEPASTLPAECKREWPHTPY